jgi:hypothetical protein
MGYIEDPKDRNNTLSKRMATGVTPVQTLRLPMEVEEFFEALGVPGPPEDEEWIFFFDAEEYLEEGAPSSEAQDQREVTKQLPAQELLVASDSLLRRAKQKSTQQ